MEKSFRRNVHTYILRIHKSIFFDYYLLKSWERERRSMGNASKQSDKNPPTNASAPTPPLPTDEISDSVLFPEYAKILQARGIRYLTHFTNADNLENIFMFGLLSRNKLIRQNISYKCSDPNRYDGSDNICLSVEFPNYKMFYAKRKQHQLDDWVVLWIDARVLMERKARFFTTNAAGVNALPLFGVSGFEQLFHGSSRPQDLPPKLPTDPQAEAQIEDHIPSEYIKYVFFENERAYNKYRKCVPLSVYTRISAVPFGAREAYLQRGRISKETPSRTPSPCPQPKSSQNHKPERTRISAGDVFAAIFDVVAVIFMLAVLLLSSFFCLLPVYALLTGDASIRDLLITIFFAVPAFYAARECLSGLITVFKQDK